MRTPSTVSASSDFRTIRLQGLALATALLLTGCENTTQTTSGRDYLSRYPTAMGAPTALESPGAAGSGTRDLDRLVAEVAAIEPELRFPARIGLARVEHGRLINVPAAEGETWLDLREALGHQFGVFVPLNLAVAEMVYAGAGTPAVGQGTLAESIARVRLGAARQHLDAVLIYEVATASDVRSTGWSIIDWTVVGAYARTRRAHAEGYATALLIDVRNGYPYGTATAAANDERATALFGGSEQRAHQRNSVSLRAVASLAPEVESMFRRLHAQVSGTSVTHQN